MDLQPITDAAGDEVRKIMARDGMLGVSAVLVDGGDAAWQACFGVTDTGGRPIDPHTIFSLQSTSKNFAATGVMIAVQRGLLDLDQPITDHLPRFAVASRHERDPQAKMTLRLLLSHRAGFTHEAPLGGNYEPGLQTASPSFEAHVDSISRTWLRYPVGERYAYSNLGIDLAGYVLMQACGAASWGECLKALIFDPLGMADTTASPAEYGARENRAIGHQAGFAAVPLRVPMEAAGGVYSSAADMVRYLAFHLGRGTFEGRSILRRELWEEMHTPTYPGAPYALGMVKQRLELRDASLVLCNHNGGGYGFGSCFTYCPDQQLGWLALFNGQTHPDAPPSPFDAVALKPALQAQFGPPQAAAPPATPPIELSAEAARPRVGNYVAGQSMLGMDLRDGALELRGPGDTAPNRLAFTAPDTAYVAEGARVAQAVHFHPPQGVGAAWIEVGEYGAIFDFNDRDGDPPGPVGAHYDGFLGTYAVIQWGQTILQVPLTKKNGYLYLGRARLTEHMPGLLFSADGEALDLRGPVPTFRNITLTPTPRG